MYFPIETRLGVSWVHRLAEGGLHMVSLKGSEPGIRIGSTPIYIYDNSSHIYDIVSASPCNLLTLKKHRKNGQRLQTGERAPWLYTGYQRTVIKGVRETTSAVPASGDVQTRLESGNQCSRHSAVGTAVLSWRV